MKSFFRPSFQIPPLLLSIATICTVFPTMGAGLRQQNYSVPNVVQAFNALEHHPEVLAFRPSADVPFADGNLAHTDTHYQGIQHHRRRSVGPLRNYRGEWGNRLDERGPHLDGD